MLGNEVRFGRLYWMAEAATGNDHPATPLVGVVPALLHYGTLVVQKRGNHWDKPKWREVEFPSSFNPLGPSWVSP